MLLLLDDMDFKQRPDMIVYPQLQDYKQNTQHMPFLSFHGVNDYPTYGHILIRNRRYSTIKNMEVNRKIAAIRTDYGLFSCVFEKEKDVSTWGAHCDAISGAFTVGSTLAEAKKMMKEVLELHIESKAEDNLVRSGRVKVLKKDGVVTHI